MQLLGNPRTTLDIDYIGSDDPPPTDKLAAAIESLAIEMQIEAEGVPLAEFMPLPEGAVYAIRNTQDVHASKNAPQHLYDPTIRRRAE